MPEAMRVRHDSQSQRQAAGPRPVPVPARPAHADSTLVEAQQALGNQVVQRLLRSNLGVPHLIQRKCATCAEEERTRSPGVIQRMCAKCRDELRGRRASAVKSKLAINAPGDRYEQEADRVADAVLRMSEPDSAGRVRTSGLVGRPRLQGRIQRMCAECEEEQRRHPQGVPVQRMCAECAGERDVDAREVDASVMALSGTGTPLPESVLAFFEPRFGNDFSHVRIHTDAKAAESARGVNALAYTIGSDIIFAAGQYAPIATTGQRLLAHELTHVVQQRRTGQNNLLQRLCGEKAIGRTPPRGCVLVSQMPKGQRFLFNVNCDEFAPGEEAKLDKFIDDLKKASPPEAEVEILGMASAEGDPGFNAALSCKRADVAASLFRDQGLGGLIKQPIRATGGVPGTEHDQNFRAVDISIKEPVVTNIKVTAKSFIAPIGSRIGALPFRCGLLVTPPILPVPPTTAQTRLAALAAATDLMFSENPTSDTKDKGYRLFTERTFSVACSNGRISSVAPTVLDTDSGTEGPLQAPPLITTGVTARITSPTTFAFSWTALGRPHPAAEPPFQLVCPRTSVFIWHRVEGVIDCSGLRFTGPTPIVGSQFPSHRVFVDGTAKPTVPQGPFSNLWVASPAGSTIVR